MSFIQALFLRILSLDLTRFIPRRRPKLAEPIFIVDDPPHIERGED